VGDTGENDMMKKKKKGRKTHRRMKERTDENKTVKEEPTKEL